MSEENRQYPRAKVNWPVTIKTRRGPISGIIKDISAGGASVTGWRRLKPQEESQPPDYHSRSSKLRLSIGARVIRQDTELLDGQTTCFNIGIQFTELSGEAREVLSTLVSTRLRREDLEPETSFEQPASEETKMAEENSQFPEVKISPDSYPMIKLHWEKQGEYEHGALETDVSFPRELWVSIAKACDEIAHGMDTFSSPRVRKALTVMADRIIVEIDAEDRRLKYKDSYESFLDFVETINSRTDLDRVRKSQLIHEEALKMQLQSQETDLE